MTHLEKLKQLKEKWFEELSWDKLDEEVYGPDARQAWVKLDNGFEVSIVRHQHSYGGSKGLYEVGVFRNGSMATPKGWDDQVKGWLPPLLVCDTLLKLEDSEYHDNATIHNRSVEVMKLHDHPPSLKSLINSN